jgi:hypothetical protein
MEVGCKLQTLAALGRGEEHPRYPLERKLVGPQSRPEHYGEEKLESNSDPSVKPRSSSLYRLSYPSSQTNLISRYKCSNLSETLKVTEVNNFIKLVFNKKFWEEQIAYFLLIRHGPYRKRRGQQFFYCCV